MSKTEKDRTRQEIKERHEYRRRKREELQEDDDEEFKEELDELSSIGHRNNN